MADLWLLKLFWIFRFEGRTKANFLLPQISSVFFNYILLFNYQWCIFAHILHFLGFKNCNLDKATVATRLGIDMCDVLVLVIKTCLFKSCLIFDATTDRAHLYRVYQQQVDGVNGWFRIQNSQPFDMDRLDRI